MLHISIKWRWYKSLESPIYCIYEKEVMKKDKKKLNDTDPKWKMKLRIDLTESRTRVQQWCKLLFSITTFICNPDTCYDASIPAAADIPLNVTQMMLTTHKLSVFTHRLMPLCCSLPSLQNLSVLLALIFPGGLWSNQRLAELSWPQSGG